MAKAAGVLAAVDPAVSGRVSESTSKLSLEAGLNAIAKQYRAQWRKVYLTDAEIPKMPDGTVDARRLKRLVSAAAAAPPVNIGIVDPATGLMTVTYAAPETAAAMKDWAKTRKAVYLLYKPDGPNTSNAMADTLPPGGIDALRAMTPDQRKQWMEAHGGVMVSSEMSPEERAAALSRLPADQRAEIEKKLQDAEANGGQFVMTMQHRENNE
jgi:hypothetical protein